MKARVNTFLNIRTGTPEILVENNSNDLFFKPGDVVEIAETIVGEEYKGNDVWHKLETGVFINNFGVDVDKTIFFKEIVGMSIDNNLSKKVILTNAIIKTGKGLVIGVLDSGIDDIGHDSLKSALISNEDFLTPKNSAISNGHGTRVAGILVGNDSKITGIAIDAKIRSYRVVKNIKSTSESALKTVLQKIIDENINIDILNLSLNISDASVPFFQPLIYKIVALGILIFVAGNAVSITQINSISKLKNVIVVGVFPENEFIRAQASNGFASSHCFFLNSPIITTDLVIGEDNHIPFSSSSAYTALTSGIVAGFLSNKFIPKNKRFTETISFLNNCSFSIKDESKPTPFKIYKA